MSRQASMIDVAQEYLQTVVIVDDRMVLTPIEDEAEEVLEPDLLTLDVVPELSVAASLKIVDLDVKALVDAFSETGLFCTPVVPTRDEAGRLSGDSFSRLFRRADVVVLDWSLANDGGRATRHLIRDLVDRQGRRWGRLRLICIYTGESDLSAIQQDLAEDLSDLDVQISGPETGEVIIKSSDFRIAIFAKADTKLPSHLQSAIVVESELPRRIITEFATVAAGLLSALTLRSLSVLRDNVSYLLGRFSESIDAAFVSHALLVDDADQFAVQLVVGEIAALLDGSVVAREVYQSQIQEWISQTLAKPDHVPQLRYSGTSYEVGLDWVQSLVDDRAKALRGVADASGKRVVRPRDTATVTRLFTGSDEEADQSDHQLGLLSCVARSVTHPFIGASPPALQLGTVLARDLPNDAVRIDDKIPSLGRERGRSFWLCIQPLCDSVRIDGLRAFPMLPLFQDEAKFDFVAVDADGRKLKLRVSTHPYEIIMPEFQASIHRTVVSKTVNGQEAFIDIVGDEWQWIADLRPDHARRIGQLTGNAVARLGLDESEWLRLNGRNLRDK